MYLRRGASGFFTAVLFMIFTTGMAAAESVVATTSWTAAFALAAGAEDVQVLAPAEMLHPSEYELTPADILKLKKADLIIYAGYEVMVKAFRDSLDIPDEKLLQIETRHDAATVESSLMKIGRRLGTLQAAEASVSLIADAITDGREALSGSVIIKEEVWVHSFQRPLAGSLGIDFSGTFGPQPLTAAEIGKAAKQEPGLVIDNVHNPVAGPVLEAAPGAASVVWRNFPEVLSPTALLDVIQGNIDSVKILYGVR